MIKVHLRDGKTLSFDLTVDDERKRWEEMSSHREFTEMVTGMGVLHDKHWHTLPSPKMFHRYEYGAELVRTVKNGVETNVGERVTLQADDVRVTLMVYFGHRPKMARVDMKRIGKQRFSPKGN